MERIHVDDVLLQTIVTLLNLGARKAGLGAPPGEQGPTPDWEQVRKAIEAARALLPLVEPRHARAARRRSATRSRSCRWPTPSSRRRRRRARRARAAEPAPPKPAARGPAQSAAGSGFRGSSGHVARRHLGKLRGRSGGGPCFRAAALRCSSERFLRGIP